MTKSNGKSGSDTESVRMCAFGLGRGAGRARDAFRCSAAAAVLYRSLAADLKSRTNAPKAVGP